MDIYPVLKLDLSIRSDLVKGKSEEELKKIIDENVSPVILAHLSNVPKAEWEVHCTADTRGGVSCSGGIRGSF